MNQVYYDNFLKMASNYRPLESDAYYEQLASYHTGRESIKKRALSYKQNDIEKNSKFEALAFLELIHYYYSMDFND